MSRAEHLWEKRRTTPCASQQPPSRSPGEECPPPPLPALEPILRPKSPPPPPLHTHTHTHTLPPEAKDRGPHCTRRPGRGGAEQPGTGFLLPSPGMNPANFTCAERGPGYWVHEAFRAAKEDARRPSHEKSHQVLNLGPRDSCFAHNYDQPGKLWILPKPSRRGGHSNPR